MPVTAEGPLSNSMIGCAELLSASATWQQVIAGVAEPFGQFPQVHFPCVDLVKHPTAARPWAIIGSDAQAKFELDCNGYDIGELLLTFEFPIPVEYRESESDAEINFRNLVGKILREMIELKGTLIPGDTGNTYWNLFHVQQIDAPAKADLTQFETTEDFYGALYVVEYR